MIRRRDQLRLCLQKLGLRKKRAAFSIISVALGVTALVTINSLRDGLREAAMRTMWTDEFLPGTVKIYVERNPYQTDRPGAKQEPKGTRRQEFLTEEVFAEIRKWPGVGGADRPVSAQPVSVEGLPLSTRAANSIMGMPAALIDQHSTTNLAADVVPVLVGEHRLRTRVDEKTRKMMLADETEARQWIGRPVSLVVGDNYRSPRAYEYDYTKEEFRLRTEEELEQERAAFRKRYRAQYDLNLFDRTLVLHGVIAGTCPGGDIIVPVDVAARCEQWIRMRNELAVLQPPKKETPTEFGEQGRRTAREGEYTEGIVVAKPGADLEKLAKRVESIGFYASTRERVFHEQVKEFESGLRMVRYVVYAVCGVILLLAGGLVWSTTSKIVSDSRTDIGLFRALGATRTDIRKLFLGDAVLLGLLGSVLGIGLGWAAASFVSRWSLSVARDQITEPSELLLVPKTLFAYDISFCLWLLVGAAGLTLLAGWWPAHRASHVDPVKALKRE